MAAKPTPPAKRRGGPTQPESKRERRQKLLRLHPAALSAIAEMAAEFDAPESYVVEAAVSLLRRQWRGEDVLIDEELPDVLTELYDRDGVA